MSIVETPIRHAIFIGRVVEGNASWIEVRYCLPWWPDEPIQSWMVPGTYQEEG